MTAAAQEIAAAILAADNMPELVAQSVSHQFRQLSVAQVAALLSVSESTVRRCESLMGISRDVPGIGRRWDAREVSAWIRLHPQQGERFRKCQLQQEAQQLSPEMAAAIATGKE